MVAFYVAIAVTLFISMALLMVFLTWRSPVADRLMQVTAIKASAGGRIRSPISVVSTAASWFAPVRRVVGLGEDSTTTTHLALAGYRDPAATEIFFAAKLMGPVVAGLIAGFLLRDNLFFWFVILAVVGFFGPDIWLTSAVSRRRERIRLALPDALDLLVICMEAGLGMDQALIRVGEDLRLSHKDLSDELQLVNLEQRAGKPRIEAWRNMAERTKLDIVRSFVNMLMQTERFGTPLSKSLSVFADSLRLKRRQLAEELAAKTTIKLVFPLALFIFPAMGIVLMGPAAITISRSLAAAFGKH